MGLRGTARRSQYLESGHVRGLFVTCLGWRFSLKRGNVSVWRWGKLATGRDGSAERSREGNFKSCVLGGNHVVEWNSPGPGHLKATNSCCLLESGEKNLVRRLFLVVISHFCLPWKARGSAGMSDMKNVAALFAGKGGGGGGRAGEARKYLKLAMGINNLPQKRIRKGYLY